MNNTTLYHTKTAKPLSESVDDPDFAVSLDESYKAIQTIIEEAL